MIKTVHLTNKNKFGIYGHSKGMCKNVKICGADVETIPYLLVGVNDEYQQVSLDDIDSVFVRMVDNFVERDNNVPYSQHIIFFHNAFFDLQVIFRKYKDRFLHSYFELDYNRDYTFSEKESDIKVKVYTGKCIRAEILFYTTKKVRRVLILDSFMFFKTSLKRLSIDFDLEHKKLDEFDESLSIEDMILYGKNDVNVEKDLGVKILEFYRLYDIPFPFSMPNAAAKILRKNFLIAYGSYIPQVPKCFLKFCEYSYHGGKNGYYLDGVQKIKDVVEVDIISAYPYAMTQIPNFNRCDYILVNEYVEHMDGVYVFSGIIRESKYKIFYTHDFRVIEKGVNENKHKKDITEITEHNNYFYVKNLCVTSYELRTALKHGLVEIDNIQGCLVKEQLNKNGETIYNPIKAFVKHFFELKQKTPKSDSKYNFYKITLNSLYGKFIEANQIEDYDNHEETESGELIETEKEYKAGALYNPLLASLITGFVRAQIFELEIKYNSLHTSTDSIKTTINKNKIVNIGKELGQLEIAHEGDCLFFRNKCYIHFGDELKTVHHGVNCNIKTNKYGDRITHDEQGNKYKHEHIVCENLLKMYLNNNYEYKNERMGTIRESIKRVNKKIVPCDLNIFEKKFNVKITHDTENYSDFDIAEEDLN